MNEHEDIEVLIPEFIRGELSPSDRERVVAHLARCAECRARESELRELLSDLNVVAQSLQQDHPADDELARYVASPARLSEDEQARIALHLQLCRVCSDDVAAIAELDKHVTFETPAEHGVRAGVAPGQKRGFFTTLMRPVFAYPLAAVLLLLFLVPAVRKWRPAQPGSSEATPAAGQAQSPGGSDRDIVLIVPLREQTRSTSRQKIALDPDQETLALRLAFMPEAGRRYEVVIESSSGDKILHQPVTDEAVRERTINVQLRATELVNGDYTASVRGISNAQGLTAVRDTARTFYPFTIERPLGR